MELNQKTVTILFLTLVVLCTTLVLTLSCSLPSDFPEMEVDYMNETDLTPEQRKETSIREAVLSHLKFNLQKIYNISDECADKVYETCNTFVGEMAYKIRIYEKNLGKCVYKILDKECKQFLSTGDIVQRFKNNHELAFDDLSSKDAYMLKGKVEGFKHVDNGFFYYFNVQDDKERYVQIQLKEKLEVNTLVWVECRYGGFYFPHQTFSSCILIHQQSGK